MSLFHLLVFNILINKINELDQKLGACYGAMDHDFTIGTQGHSRVGQVSAIKCNKIVFFHLPKAGGSSIMDHMRDSAGKIEVIPYASKSKSPKPVSWQEFLKEQTRHPIKRKNVLIEHHKKLHSFLNQQKNLEKLRNVYAKEGCNFHVLLIIREPLSLYQSAFCFRPYAVQRSWPKVFSIESSKLFLQRDLQVKWLIHSGWLKFKKFGINEDSVREIDFLRLLHVLKRKDFFLVITPKSQKYYLAYVQKKLGIENIVCEGTHSNALKAKECRNNTISESDAVELFAKDKILWDTFGDGSTYSSNLIDSFRKAVPECASFWDSPQTSQAPR